MQSDDKPLRKIIHVDMDAFYASVEQRDDPSLKGKPVAVGGGHRGVVMAASYEAREFGVRSAMPSVTAKRRCPELVFVKTRFDVYRAVSQQIRKIFFDYTDLVEPLSLDEAYLDVTEDRHGLGSARAIAEDIRRRIREECQLTASAGVSYCKFIAKLASDYRKPDGITVITPERGEEFVASLPIARFHGVGPVTAQKMERLGIFTGADLREWSIPRSRRSSEARPTGTGGSAAASTSGRSGPTGLTSRSARSGPSTKTSVTPTAWPPNWNGSRAMPGTASSGPGSRAGPSRSR